MPKINILPASVYSRIAAGEVIDRPCSVVKELVENSIDAGATQIEIHIEQGGKQLIRVIDNGCGIERDDLHSAFLPHATSKIVTDADIASTMTLGFRGEAIASIAAVSRMTITSKTEEGRCYKLSCDGGALGQIVETTGEKGTDVCVETLFYHTPVRLRFLKTDKAEELEITNLISRFILNRSDIAFTYYANGKLILQSFGGGDEEAMLSVYGAAVLAECFCVDAEKHGIRIRGYIGNQNFYKANKSYQSIFLNGRYITNATIAAAISNAYASYLMKRQYPFYVLHIEAPVETIDVNVHPNKSDVRLADNQIFYGCIYSVISSILDGQRKAMDYVIKAPMQTAYVEPEPSQATEKEIQPPPFTPSLTYEEAKKELEESAPVFTAKKKGIDLPFEVIRPEDDEEADEVTKESRKPAYPQGVIPKGQLSEPLYTLEELNAPLIPIVEHDTSEMDPPKDISKVREIFPDLYFEPMNLNFGEEKKKVEPVAEDVFAVNKRLLEELDEKNKREQPTINVDGFQYIGKMFNTYLMYQAKDDIYIIDQHAAHERLIFDRLQSLMRRRKVIRQPLLTPFILHLNYFETDFLCENQPHFEEMGFVIKKIDENTVHVLEIPLDLQTIDLKFFFNTILGEINGIRAIKLENLLKDRLAAEACKAAVKGGMDLTRSEIDKLFTMMNGDMGLKCPHGRPVVVKMTKKQIEKLFKRIV